MSIPSLSRLFAIALVAVATPACVEPTDGGEADEPVPDDTIFFETVVRTSADGTVVVSEPRAITAGEQRAQNERRLAIERGEEVAPTASLAQDFGCLYDSVWLYARTDWTGDRICFRDPGVVYLRDYWRYALVNGQPFPIANWEIRTGGYWAGAAAGEMWSYDGLPIFRIWTVSWYAWESRKVLNQPTPAHLIRLW